MKCFLLLFTLSCLAPAQSTGVWQDPATGKVWANADNGSGVSWSQAVRYCRTSSLGGHHDWKLPTIEDLQQLVTSGATAGGFRVTGQIKLTGWAWSSSPGQEHGEAWALDFGDGGRASVVAGDSGLNRALCRRGSLSEGGSR
jgi:Protein of unknown function (DUF1566)